MTMNRRGFSIIEYIFLIIIILSMILVFRNYILRAFNGKYKAVGDSYGFGRQYDPSRTVACGYDDRINPWYDEQCFDNERQKCAVGNDICEENVLKNKCNKNYSMCNDGAIPGQ